MKFNPGNYLYLRLVLKFICHLTDNMDNLWIINMDNLHLRSVIALTCASATAIKLLASDKDAGILGSMNEILSTQEQHFDTQ